MEFLYKNKNVILSLVLLTILFLYSVFVRLPQIGSPLNLHHHEWLSGHMLITLSIWEMAGIQNYHFSPIYTFPNYGDKFIQTTFVGGIVTDSRGDMYYLSYPPLGFILPFVFFKLLSLPVSPFSLQIFSLLLHLVGTLFIFGTINAVRKAPFFSFDFGALLGATVYLFTPATLWFTFGVYFSDMLVQVFWITGCYLFIKIVQQRDFNGILFKLLCMMTFLMVYTEWIGVFFAFAVVCYMLFKQKRISWQIVAITGSVVLALILMFVQYSSIDGASKYGDILYQKFLSRSGFGEATKSDAGITIRDQFARERLISFYTSGYGAVLRLFAFVIASYFFVLKKIKGFLVRDELLFLLCCMVPILLHHLLLFNFTAIHDFSVFKTAFLLSVVTGIFWRKLLTGVRLPLQIVITLLLGIFIILSGVKSYLEQNSVAAVRDAQVEQLALQIKSESENDEVVFATDGAFNNPSFIYYAQRDILICPDIQCASYKLTALGKKKGVLFVVDQKFKISYVERIQL